jgi:hypothetical protein
MSTMHKKIVLFTDGPVDIPHRRLRREERGRDGVP